MKNIRYTQKLKSINESIDLKIATLKIQLKFLKEESQNQYSFNKYQNSRAVNGTINIDKFLKADVLKDPKLEKEELAKMTAEYNGLLKIFKEKKTNKFLENEIIKQMKTFDR